MLKHIAIAHASKSFRRLDGSDATVRDCTRTAERSMIEGASARERSRGELTGLPREHGLKRANHERLVVKPRHHRAWLRRCRAHQRSLAAHPCRALTVCGVHNVPICRALKLFELVPKLPVWCRSRDSPLMSNNSAVALRAS